MPFKIATREMQAGSTTSTVFTLADEAGASRIEVWPKFGFNCLRWAVKGSEAFYTDPEWEANPLPTRSGHPILFPFPNRLKDGRFTFEGIEYQLPLNESTGKHAIHGFTPKLPWRVVGTEAGKDYASITGEFHLGLDHPNLADFWPSDFSILVTYKLRATTLEVAALVRNVGEKRMPFGLGYHPYFCLPSLPNAAVDDFLIQVPAKKLWTAVQSLATGETEVPPAEFDFFKTRPVGSVELDHLYGSLKPQGRTVALLSHPSAKEQIRIEADHPFRELLLFTPPHRKALAIEPYTCTTDALNFAPRGIDAGLRVLEAGKEFASEVKYSVEPKGAAFAD